jgi:lipopolysaccharide/colanic/teichoic acid biosynthesis glycosyltransferase
LSGIHSLERFCHIVEYERTRAIRSGQVLSLVVFDAKYSGNGTPMNGHLTHVLTKRIRSIDEAGWLDDQHIGVLLPYTSTVGAWRFADDVCNAIAAKSSPPHCTVYSYPSNLFCDNNGQSTQLHFQDISPAWRTTTSLGFSISIKHEDGQSTDSATQRYHPDNRVRNDMASAENQTSFFRYPLPIWKRTMDITGALFGLIILSPLMLIVIALIKIVSPGPAFFKQKRVGYMGKIFTMWKFRTMKVNADAKAHQQYLAELISSAAYKNKNSAKPMTKLDGQLQIIPFGRFLRHTCIDELPQLINVLRGEMTLVGPRPPIPYEVKEYLNWHKGRIDVVPGMTGLWQVSGKNRLTFNEMVCLDIQYWRKKSPWLDIKILLMTPVVMFTQIKDSLRKQKLQKSGGTKNG